MDKQTFKGLAVQVLDIIPHRHIEILERHGILHRYISEVISFSERRGFVYDNSQFYSMLKAIAAQNDFRNFVASSFDWTKTKEGNTFWNEISGLAL